MTKKQQSLVNKLKRLAEQHTKIAARMRADANKVAEKIGNLQDIHDAKVHAIDITVKKQNIEYSKAVNSAIAAGLPMGVALAIGAPKSPAANILNN